MTRATFDPLSDEDARILRLGSGAIRAHTCKVLVLEPSAGRPLPTVDAISDRVASRLDAAPRFRQRVVCTPLRLANPVWSDDPEFDIRRHVTRVETGGDVDRAHLKELVADLMARRLDRRHPLWHIAVVERMSDGTMALIWRVHHCLADGTTCMRIASAIFWDLDPAPAAAPPSPWSPRPGPSSWGLLARGLGRYVTPPRLHPGRAASSLASLPALKNVIRRELRGSASLTTLAAPIGEARTVAFASVPLEDAKQAGKAIGDSVTVNDVVLSIIAGGVGSWLGSRLAPDDSIRVKVPVSLHHQDARENVANHDSYFFVDLPVGEPDAAKRVLAINRETRERKLHHDAETLYRLGLHPAFAHWAMSPRVFTFNVSNVRGPRMETSIHGARVRELYSLAEIAHQHALRIAVISAAGSLFFGLCADRKLVGDLEVLADGITQASDALLQLLG